MFIILFFLEKKTSEIFQNHILKKKEFFYFPNLDTTGIVFCSFNKFSRIRVQVCMILFFVGMT